MGNKHPYQVKPDAPAQWELFLRAHGWTEPSLDLKQPEVRQTVKQWVREHMHKTFVPVAVIEFFGWRA